MMSSNVFFEPRLMCRKNCVVFDSSSVFRQAKELCLGTRGAFMLALFFPCRVVMLESAWTHCQDPHLKLGMGVTEISIAGIGADVIAGLGHSALIRIYSNG